MEDSNATNDATPTEEVFAKPSLPGGIKYGLRQIKKSDQDEQLDKLKAEHEAKLAASVNNNNNIELPPNFKLMYEPPFWDAPPSMQFHLEVIKNGQTTDKIDISKKGHYLFGRVPVCDVILEHNSISRQHAVLQFRENGTAYLYDLDSSHGTFVNKQRIKAKTYRELKVGDVIKFGQSTRLYIFEGPPPDVEELEKEEDRIRQERQERREQKMKAALEARETQMKARQEATQNLVDLFQKDWDAEAREKAEQEQKVVVPEAKKAEKEVKEINFEEDEDEEKAKKKQPETKTEKTDKEIEAEEEAAFAEWEEDDTTTFQQKKSYRIEDDFDDDFYDRTKKDSIKINSLSILPRTESKKPANKVETLASLQAKKASLDKQRDDLLAKIDLAERRASGSKSEVDSLDAFMTDISSGLKTESKKKLEYKLKEVETEREKILKLIAIAKPSLEKQKMPPPQPKPVVNKQAVTASAELKDKSEVITTSSGSTVTEDHTPRDKMQKRQNTKQTDTPGEVKKQKLEYEQPLKEIEEDEDVVDWMPPENQAGDGKTVLNKLYGY